MPSCKISWWKNVHEKGKICSKFIYNIVNLGKMAGKTQPFSYWKNLLMFLNDVKQNICSSLEFG